MKERRRARGWALQVLYAWEARGGREDELVPTYDEIATNHNMSPRNRLYTEALVRLAARHMGEIDRILQQSITNWSLSRLSVIDRNILRIGVVELLWIDDVPAKVTIQEMMRLADLYGTEESPRFINGILDAVMRGVAVGGASEIQ